VVKGIRKRIESCWERDEEVRSEGKIQDAAYHQSKEAATCAVKKEGLARWTANQRDESYIRLLKFGTWEMAVKKVRQYILFRCLNVHTEDKHTCSILWSTAYLIRQSSYVWCTRSAASCPSPMPVSSIISQTSNNQYQTNEEIYEGGINEIFK
jgi:hypothetical protein